MSNTTIQLKKSATPTAVPSNLANGELAINYADGKLFYKAANGTIAAISGAGGSGANTFATMNANGTLVVADSASDVLSFISGNNISIVGDAVNDSITIGLKNSIVVPGDVNVGKLYITAVGGDEGGELRLDKPPNGTLAGGVIIDAHQNKIRIFEDSGTNRGVFIDLSLASASVGTDLLSGTGSVDSEARATAAGAFNKANAANVLAFNALPNTNGAIFSGSFRATANVEADRFISNNNGLGENYKVGDDAWIGDTNIANAFRVKGQQNTQHGYISFGTADSKTFGRKGTEDLTWDANTIWTAGNDGAGSGLDADLLDGQHGSFYATDAKATAAFAQANAAPGIANTYATSVGTSGNAYALATATSIGAASNAWANSIVTSANNFAGTMANSANGFATTVGASANARANTVGTSANAFATSVGTSGNAYALATATSIGTAGNSYATAVGTSGNAYATAVGTSGNTFAASVGVGANAFATTVGTSANAYATAVGTSGNAYALSIATSVGTAGNSYATAVGTSGNTYATSVGVGANSYATAVGTSANGFAVAIGASANGWANTKVSSSGGTITGSLSITGNLTVSGNTNFVSVSNFLVDDPLIYLAANNNVSDIVDIGFIGSYANATGANVFTGLYREHADKMYYLFQGYDRVPANNHLGALSNNMTLAVLNADVRTSNLFLFGANAQQFIISAFAQANAAPGIANTYATAVGTSGNTFASSVGVAANTYATSVGTSGNAYATSVGTSGNSFTITVFNTANIALATAQSAFDKANTGTASSNVFTSNVVISVADNTNAALRITQTGAGHALLVEDDTNPDSTPFVVNASGNVGIGNTSPTAKLHIQSDSAVNMINYTAGGNTQYVFQRSNGSISSPTIIETEGTIGGIIFQGYDGEKFVTAASIIGGSAGGTPGLNDMPGRLIFNTTSDGASSASERMRISASGNLGVATSNPTSRLHVVGTSNITSSAVFGSNVGIGRTDSTVGQNVKLDVAGGVNSSILLVNGVEVTSIANSYATSVGASANNWANTKLANTSGVSFSGDLTVTGNVGIGTAHSSNFRLEVGGAFAATTKSFVIPHPSKENMSLRYGSLEGPENGVYVRGIATSDVIDLPDYWNSLVDESTVTVNLTGINSKPPSVNRIENNKVYLNKPLFSKIHCYYTVFAERKDVDKLIVEY